MKTIIVEKNGRVRVGTKNPKPDQKAQQQFKDQCDVNLIVAKYKNTGEWLHLTKRQGVYADVSAITDYHESLQKVLDANAAFAALPASIRTRFDNDPAKLLAFMQDKENYAEGVKIGLFEKKQVTANNPDTIKNEPNESKNMREQNAEPKPSKQTQKNSTGSAGE